MMDSEIRRRHHQERPLAKLTDEELSTLRSLEPLLRIIKDGDFLDDLTTLAFLEENDREFDLLREESQRG